MTNSEGMLPDQPEPRHLPGRPVISDACRQRIAELIANCPPLSDDQRALIRTEIRAGRRLHSRRRPADE